MRIARVLCLLLCVIAALTVWAGNTGGYRGPDGNGVYPATGLLREWPADGPKLLWKVNLGEGYAGPTVLDDTVYMPGGIQGVLYAYTLDGRLKNRYPFGSCVWTRWSGTRSTPVVRDGIAVCTTPGASVTALDLRTGEQRWNINSWKSFGKGQGNMGWGYPESPVLIGDKLIVNTCSRFADSPPFVAVDFQTGKTVWELDQAGKNKNYACGDGSSAAIRHNGKDYYVGVSWRHISFIDAETGKLIWEIDTSLPGGTEKNMKPVYHDGYLLLDLGGRLLALKLSDDGNSYTPVWSRAYGGGFVQSVTLGGRLYIVGRPSVASRDDRPAQADGTPAPAFPEIKTANIGPDEESLLCIDIPTGKVISSVPRSGAQGHVISADGMLYMVDDAGSTGFRLRLIKLLDDGGMQVVGDYTHKLVPEDIAGIKAGDEMRYSGSSCPVIADGRLFLKYGSFFVFDLRAEAAADGARRDGMGQAANAHPPIKWWREENLQWTTVLPGAGKASPVTDGDRVFVANEPNILACVDAVTGKQLWQQAVDGAEGMMTPIVREDGIFVASSTGVVACFDSQGALRWRATVQPGTGDMPVAAPALSEKLVLVQGKALYAFEAATGKPAWDVAMPDKAVLAAPVKYRLKDTNIIVTSWGAILRAVDGKVLWTPTPAMKYAGAVADKGTLYIGGVTENNSGMLVALTLPASATEGIVLQQLWQQKTNSSATDTMVVFDGILYTLTAQANLVARDANTGKLLYTQSLLRVSRRSPITQTGLTVAGGLLYATLNDDTFVVKPGAAYSEVWHYIVKGGASESAYAGDRQFLRGGDRLYCVAGETPVIPVAPVVTALAPGVAPAGAPVQAFANDKTPDTWAVAGPFNNRDLTKDYLAGLGGRAAAVPKVGDTAKLANEEATFRAIADTDFYTDARFTNGMKSVDVTGVLAREKNVSGLLSTVVGNDSPRYVRFKLLTPDGISWNYRQRLDTLAWLAGQPVSEQAVYKLDKGQYPLLIQATIGEVEGWGKIWMAPRLVDVTAETEKKLAEYDRRKAGWPAYQASLKAPFVLAP